MASHLHSPRLFVLLSLQTFRTDQDQGMGTADPDLLNPAFRPEIFTLWHLFYIICKMEAIG
jgi:hypothetical protein